MTEYVDRRASLLVQTNSAWKVYIRANNLVVWLPKSQCEIVNYRVNELCGQKTYTFRIPKWLFKTLKDSK